MKLKSAELLESADFSYRIVVLALLGGITWGISQPGPVSPLGVTVAGIIIMAGFFVTVEGGLRLEARIGGENDGN